MQLGAGLALHRLTQASVNVPARGTGEIVRGRIRSSLGVQGLAGDLLRVLGLEGVFSGCCAGGVCLGVELGVCVVADFGTRGVLLYWLVRHGK